MASNGLLRIAKTGKCRICQRVRKTYYQVKAVGEVHHGFATGHIWECINIDECNQTALSKLNKSLPGSLVHEQIKSALRLGRFDEYTIKR